MSRTTFIASLAIAGIATLACCSSADAQFRAWRRARRYPVPVVPVPVPSAPRVAVPSAAVPPASGPQTAPSAAVPSASGPSFPSSAPPSTTRLPTHAEWMHMHMHSRRAMFHEMMRARLGIAPVPVAPTEAQPTRPNTPVPLEGPNLLEPNGAELLPPGDLPPPAVEIEPMIEPSEKPITPPPLPSPVPSRASESGSETVAPSSQRLESGARLPSLNGPTTPTAATLPSGS